jgi:hypothetical protein
VFTPKEVKEKNKMLKELQKYLTLLRPAFSRQATFNWFVIACVGFILRNDFFGVSSIIRALNLTESCYPLLLNFFHSSAWSVHSLMHYWQLSVAEDKNKVIVNNRVVFTADHTKAPKDGRKIPAVTTLLQDSETSSKPSYFRGHHWGCIAMLLKAGKRYLSTPLEANIQEGNAGNSNLNKIPKTTRIVKMAQVIAERINKKAYLVLDAYFSVGTVFNAASELKTDDDPIVQILTRAKKNVVAYYPAPKARKKKRGRKKTYGKKIKLMKIFDSNNKSYDWKVKKANVYGKNEKVRFLDLNLLWKPTKGMVRFILVESSRGRMILISSDLTLDCVTALELYCCRVTIETMFDVLKNRLGGFAYHFWSSYLKPASRRPLKNDSLQKSSKQNSTKNTLSAIEKFVNLQLCVLGMLQLIAMKYPNKVLETSCCWLRTRTSKIPSVFETRIAIGNMIKNNLSGFGKNWITLLIKSRQNKSSNKIIAKEMTSC